MAETFITKCPHCQVKFKLTSSQLEAAAGSVRCGACLNIFNAKENLTQNPPKTEVTSAEQKQPTQEQTIKEQSEQENLNLTKEEAVTEKSQNFNALEEDNGLFDLSDDSSEYAQEDPSDSLFADLDNQQSSEYDLSTSDDSDSDLDALFAQDSSNYPDSDEDALEDIFESSSEDEEPLVDFSETNESQQEDDFSDIFSQMDDDNNSFEQPKSNSQNKEDEEDEEDEEEFIFGVDEPKEFEIDDAFLEFDETKVDAFSDDAILAEEEIKEKIDNPEDQIADESWTDALLEDEQPKENKAVFEAKNLGESQTESKKEIDPHKNNSFYGEQLPNDFDNDVTTPVTQDKPTKKTSVKSNVNTIEQDTQDLDNLLEKTGSSFLNFFAWSFLSVLLLIGLVGQYVYFNFDQIAQTNARKNLIQLCEYVGCTVKDLPTQTQQASILKFEAIDHPDLEGAVKILFVLRNSFNKNIEYPNITVQVFDKNEMLLGDQTFKPQEYLPNQIKQETQMRAKVDVQASITIKNLGNNAINYQLHQ